MKMQYSKNKYLESLSTESGHYILDGQKVVPAESLLDWGKWMYDNPKKQSIRKSELNDQFIVSTVFMGLEDCIFESMIFDKNGGELDNYFIRTRSYEVALDAHDELLGMIKKQLDEYN